MTHDPCFLAVKKKRQDLALMSSHSGKAAQVWDRCGGVFGFGGETCFFWGDFGLKLFLLGGDGQGFFYKEKIQGQLTRMIP